MMAIQIIAILSLVAYMVYITYYYALPMAWFKIMKFFACKSHRCEDVRVIEEKIVVIFTASGRERRIERDLGVPLDSRFWTMTLCSTFRSMLKETKRWAE